MDANTSSQEDLRAEVLRLRSELRAHRLERVRQNAIFDGARDFAIIATDCDGLITDWNVGA